MTFTSAHPALGRALAARGYAVPTAVQLAVLEEDKAGRDLLVSAQTGSGKTVAFGLAIAPTLLGDAERLPPAAITLGKSDEPSWPACEAPRGQAGLPRAAAWLTTSPRNTALSVAPVGTDATTVHTAYGGLFYLLNIALAWRIYGDFTTPRTPGISLLPWDLLAWTGRALPEKPVACIIGPENAPSQRLAAKLGFIEAGEAGYRGKQTKIWRRKSGLI